MQGELWQYKHCILISLLGVCLVVDRRQQVLRDVGEGGAYLVWSLAVRKSTLQLQILHHVVPLFFNSQVQTCSACIVFVKPVLPKYWNEVLHHIKVAVSSSNV